MAVACALLLLLLQQADLPEAPADLRAAQMEDLRAEVSSQLQLKAFDLLDELVYGWTQAPPFAAPTPVVLASVTPPAGLGMGLQALLENHAAALLVHHPRSNVTLVHCPACTEVVVHSGREGTVLSRGVDAPEALAKVGALTPGLHALFLDLEAEGAALVLRARLTRVMADLPVIHARTLSSSIGTPALLRDEQSLKSAASARQEYLDALEGREGHIGWVNRFIVRSYAAGRTPLVLAPYVWLETGIETAFTESRAWLGNLALGFSWAPQDLHTAFSVSARADRLISGRARSLVNPDLYLFLAGTLITTSGLDAAAFKPSFARDIGDALASMLQSPAQPTATFAAWKLGLELRVKNRIRAAI
ncbi:MAG TPA: hypothetical protein VFH51_08525, partial [Myxococcota bacterium]|nr:hypothetical protein [Myxococcota bacterium]